MKLFDRIGMDVGRKLSVEDAIIWAADNSVRFLDVQTDLAPNALAEMPEVEHAVRFYRPSSVPVRYGDEPYQEEAFFYADSSVFSVFDFNLISGDPRTALAAPYTLVLTALVWVWRQGWGVAGV